MRRRLLFLLTVVLVPLAATLGDERLESLVAPAAACTGSPVFSPGAITILPEEGAVVPCNAQILFFNNVASPSMFAMRPLEPAEVRTGDRVLPHEQRASEGLGLPRLEANTRYELWLPNGLAPPWGKTPPVLERSRSFMTSGEDDTTPPRIRMVGRPVHHRPGESSCGPPARIELPIAVDDASPVFIEVGGFVAGHPEDRTSKPARVPIVSGRIITFDPIFFHMSGPASFATHLVLTPVDIAGNRGASAEVDLHRLADGGTEPPTPSSPSTQPSSSFRGCGKY